MKGHWWMCGTIGGMLMAPATGYAQYNAHNLVSDGFVEADHVDPGLVNPWGIVPNPAANGFWWVSDEDSGLSTLYAGDGTINSLVVTIPPAPSEGKGAIGHPTGIVFYGGSNFIVTNGVNSGPSRFIFATEDGTISAWNPGVPPPPPSKQAFIVEDGSKKGAGYTGLAISITPEAELLYTADFLNGEVEIYDNAFEDVKIKGAFEDRTIPRGFAPFGVQVIGESVYVTYALRNEKGEDETGPGLGYVNVFDLNGAFIKRFVSETVLNAPWGVVQAPANFGPFSGAILIGNFGDGRINAFDPETGDFLGELEDSKGEAFEVEGLWGLHFGTGLNAGPLNTLYFAAGIEDETHGLFGRIDVDVTTLADLNADRIIDGADLALLLTDWNDSGSAADINGDGTVNGVDLGLLLANWTG